MRDESVSSCRYFEFMLYFLEGSGDGRAMNSGGTGLDREA